MARTRRLLSDTRLLIVEGEVLILAIKAFVQQMALALFHKWPWWNAR